MSTFNAKCPNCSSLCDVPSTYINKEVKCPSCAETYVAEPYLELPAPPIKAEGPKDSNTPQEASLPEGHAFRVYVKRSMAIITILLMISLGFPFLSFLKPTPRWEYRIESPSDYSFTSAMNEWGSEGWEVITARRASSKGILGETEYSYECIMKRLAK